MTTKVLAFAGGVTKAVGERQVRVIVSTATPDRYGDIVEIEGIELDNFRRNPVVLFMHDHDEPIAKCPEIGVKDGRLEAVVQFPDEGVSKKSDEVYGLIKAGVLNAVSIGFMPLEWSNLDDKQPWAGRRFIKSDMMEFSIVSVPANAEALVVERGALGAEQQIALARANLAAAEQQNAGRSEKGPALDIVVTAIGDMIEQRFKGRAEQEQGVAADVEQAAPFEDPEQAARDAEIRALEIEILTAG